MVRSGGFFWLWWRFCVRRLALNPLRFLIVIVSVSLATTLACAVFQVSTASIVSFESSLAGGDNPFHVVVSPVGGRFEQRAVAHCLRGLAPYSDIVSIRREAGVVVAHGQEVPVRIAGLSYFVHGATATKSDSVVISAPLADSLGVTNPTTFMLTYNGEVQNIAVSRISQGTSYADVTLDAMRLGGTPVFDSVALRFNDNVTNYQRVSVGQWFQSCLPPTPAVRFEPLYAPIERGTALLGAYRFNVLVMVAITLVVCGILILQATQITVRGIAHEISVLKTLGVSSMRCVWMIVFEAALICCCGAVLGVTLGAPLVVFISGFLTSTASEIYNVSIADGGGAGSIVVSSGVVGVVTMLGALSGMFGAKVVAKIAPYRGSRREQTALLPLPKKHIAWGAFIATCVLGVLVLALVWYPSAPIAYTVVGAMLLWGGACVPFLVARVPALLWCMRGWLPARLSAHALRASGGSFVLSAIASTLAIALLVGLSTMVESFRSTLSTWSTTRLAGDVFVSSAVSGGGNEERLGPDIVATVRGSSFVKRVIPYYETQVSVGGSDAVVAGVSLGMQCERKVYTFIQGSCGGQTAHSAFISEHAAQALVLDVGDTFIIGKERFVVLGIIQEFGTERPLIVIDESAFTAMYPGHNPQTLTIDVVSGASVSDAKEQIASQVPATTIVRDQRALLDLVETLFNRTFRITDSVRWIVFMLALLGLVSTSGQYVWERRRELRVAEASGIPRINILWAVTIEALAVTGIASISGILAGIGIGWCLTTYINPLVFGWSLVFQISVRPIIEGFAFILFVGVSVALVARAMLGYIHKNVSLRDE